jgi:hypothetical protein
MDDISVLGVWVSAEWRIASWSSGFKTRYAIYAFKIPRAVSMRAETPAWLY